jgi:hypothetical protein
MCSELLPPGGYTIAVKHIITDKIISWRRTLLRKLIISQLGKESYPFYETRMFIVSLTTARQLSPT